MPSIWIDEYSNTALQYECILCINRFILFLWMYCKKITKIKNIQENLTFSVVRAYLVVTNGFHVGSIDPKAWRTTKNSTRQVMICHLSMTGRRSPPNQARHRIGDWNLKLKSWSDKNEGARWSFTRLCVIGGTAI